MEKNNQQINVLVNALTLNIGGGIQIGKGFIEYCANNNLKNLKLHFLLSKQLYNSINKKLLKKIKYWKLASKPSYFSKKGRETIRTIKKICKDSNYSLVYSIGFPSYINFNIPELGRYTNPWEFMPSTQAWKLLSLNEKIKRFLLNNYRIYWAKKAKFFETQTNYAAKYLKKKFKINLKKIYVINNSVNPIFRTKKIKNNHEPKKYIFCLAADYTHKNLLIIPEIAYFLNKLDKKNQYNFYMTISKKSKTWIKIQKKMKDFKVSNIINTGPLNLNECKKYYIKSDCVLQPSLLEVFSATYLEAMQMMRPLVVPNLKFVKDICGNGAIYYKYNSPLSAAKKISILLNNNKLYKKQIKKGYKILSFYPTLEKNMKKLISVIKNLSQK